jgi:glutamyl-tRNA reductase
VTLLNMDDLKAFAEAGVAERRKEIAAVNTIIEEEVDRFLEATIQRQVAPLIVALRDRAERLRTAELDRYRVRLKGLDGRQWGAVEAVTQGLVAKLLHEPTIHLKESAGSARGEELAEALRLLFDL